MTKIKCFFGFHTYKYFWMEWRRNYFDFAASRTCCDFEFPNTPKVRSFKTDHYYGNIIRNRITKDALEKLAVYK